MAVGLKMSLWQQQGAEEEHLAAQITPTMASYNKCCSLHWQLVWTATVAAYELADVSTTGVLSDANLQVWSIAAACRIETHMIAQIQLNSVVHLQ